MLNSGIYAIRFIFSNYGNLKLYSISARRHPSVSIIFTISFEIFSWSSSWPLLNAQEYCWGLNRIFTGNDIGTDYFPSSV